MNQKISFELVSPEELLTTLDADMVLVPGSDGDMGIKHGHIPIISTLRPGVIYIYNGGVIEQRLFIEGGFLEVTGTRCTVLADGAENLNTLSPEDIKQELTDIEDRLKLENDKDELQILRAQKKTAEEKLSVLENPTYH